MDLAVAKMGVEDLLGDRFDKSHQGKDRIEVCSGGIREKPTDQHPAIYSTAAQAVREWREVAEKFIDDHPNLKYRWQRLPELEKLQVTVMDARGTHRLAGDRWAVVSELAFCALPDGGTCDAP
jgi:hypothetical protein